MYTVFLLYLQSQFAILCRQVIHFKAAQSGQDRENRLVSRNADMLSQKLVRQDCSILRLACETQDVPNQDNVVRSILCYLNIDHIALRQPHLLGEPHAVVKQNLVPAELDPEWSLRVERMPDIV